MRFLLAKQSGLDPLPADLYAFLVAAQRFEAKLQNFKRVPGDVEAAAKVGVALFDAPPRFLLGAGDPVKAHLGADCGDLGPQSIALPVRQQPKSSTTSTPSSRLLQVVQKLSGRSPGIVRRADCRRTGASSTRHARSGWPESSSRAAGRAWSCRRRENRGSGAPLPWGRPVEAIRYADVRRSRSTLPRTSGANPFM
jgi:hypothetical protein